MVFHIMHIPLKSGFMLFIIRCPPTSFLHIPIMHQMSMCTCTDAVEIGFVLGSYRVNESELDVMVCVGQECPLDMCQLYQHSSLQNCGKKSHKSIACQEQNSYCLYSSLSSQLLCSSQHLLAIMYKTHSTTACILRQIDVIIMYTLCGIEYCHGGYYIATTTCSITSVP